MNFRKINTETPDYGLLEKFLQSAGTALVTFRYFSHRPLQSILGHIYTVLLVNEHEEPIAYGHLDPEGGKVWLGICVVESARNQGVGRRVMDHLIAEADLRKCPSIWLKVDAENIAAIALYRKVGFNLREEQPGLWLIMERV